MKDYSIIKLDKKRRLKFTLNAYEKLTEAVGEDFTKEIGHFLQKPKELSIKYLAFFTWAGLLLDHPGLKVEEVEEMLKPFSDDREKLKELSKALEKALARFHLKVLAMKARADRLNEEFSKI